MKKKTIAIIGAGNLGIAIANGLKKAGYLQTSQLILTRRDTSQIAHLEDDDIAIMNDNRIAVASADEVIICVQPKQFNVLIEDIKDVLDEKRHTIISVMTAVTIEQMEQKLGNGFKVFRAMPNTAISVQESMTCIAHNVKATNSIKHVQDLFNCVGKTMIIEESLMQAATVVCASGIAFWMRFIRATTQGGVQLGFDASDAQEIAVQACLGAATLLSDGTSHPENEIDKVTTPQGCTISGLNEMEHHGLSSALIKGLVTSFDRINKMKGK